VINTGFISARVKRVCKAVINDVTSRGEGGGGGSEKIACKGVEDEAVRAREKVCLRDDEKPFEVDVEDMACWIGGDGGRVCVGGDVVPLRNGVDGTDAGLPPPFFLLLNGRRNDQSDSNWTESNSEERAE
jgi:hypothetical protein